MNPRIDESAEKDIRGYFGSSGSGKTHQMKIDVGSAPMVQVFDPEASFSTKDGFTVCETRADYLRAVRAADNTRLTFQGSQLDFEWWARVVFALADARRPMKVVVDELGGLTNQGKARGGWFDLLSRGRKYNVSILAGAQRPAEIDKTLIANKNKLFIGYLERADDIKYIERETGIPAATLESLKGAPSYDHIKWAGRDQWTLVQKKPRTRKPKK